MNILIIGNGFDLAHGLPTKYADFLKFIDFFYKHKAQESSRLELIAGEDINCYKYFTDLFMLIIILLIIKLVDCLEKCLIYGHIRRFAD